LKCPAANAAGHHQGVIKMEIPEMPTQAQLNAARMSAMADLQELIDQLQARLDWENRRPADIRRNLDLACAIHPLAKALYLITADEKIVDEYGID